MKRKVITLTESQFKRLIVKEDSSYPVGADNDPKAPWNQSDVELSKVEVMDNGEEVSIDLFDNKGGQHSTTLTEILFAMDLSDEVMDYFSDINNIREFSKKFETRVINLAKHYNDEKKPEFIY